MFSIKINGSDITSIEVSENGLVCINLKSDENNEESLLTAPIYVSNKQTIIFTDDGDVLIEQ